VDDSTDVGRAGAGGHETLNGPTSAKAGPQCGAFFFAHPPALCYAAGSCGRSIAEPADFWGNEMQFLPRSVRPKAPPIKTQGIKTKVVPLIARSIAWSGEGRWVEPFVGSGAVAFNVAPQRAVLADANKHIIRMHQAIQSGEMTSANVKAYLEIEGTPRIQLASATCWLGPRNS
jgi:hypothetical protein